jgi:hypothetical protein
MNKQSPIVAPVFQFFTLLPLLELFVASVAEWDGDLVRLVLAA